MSYKLKSSHKEIINNSKPNQWWNQRDTLYLAEFELHQKFETH